jgi:hypothetical protein
MLPPPPVLAPPLGTAVAAALDDTSGVGAVGVAVAELGTGAGLDAGGLEGVAGGLDGGGVDLHVQVGDGVGVGGVGVGVGVWHWHVGLGAGVGLWWQWHPPDGAGDEL